MFGDQLTGIVDSDSDSDDDRRTRNASGGPVTVSFAHRQPEQFDLVVIAEGMRSRTRELVFGDGPRIAPVGMYTAWLTVQRVDSDTAWARWCNTTGGRAVVLRPDNLGTTRAALSFLSAPRGYEDLAADAQKALLRRTFGGVGWEVPRSLDDLDDAELYFEAIGQVHAPRWSQGRVALVGDAAYAPSPIKGMGTSSALVGAYVLAGELGARVHHRDAFRSYEQIMRPYVELAQKLPPGAPRLANPKTRAGLGASNTVLHLAATPAVRRVAGVGGGFFSPPADRIDLPT